MKLKKAILLLSPLLAFALLLIPYSWANQEFIVKWFGCGCPTVDVLGNMVYSNFNANDFTACFWLFVSVCVTIISAFLSVKIPKSKIWLRVLYVFGMFVVSILITCQFIQMMMWC